MLKSIPTSRKSSGPILVAANVTLLLLAIACQDRTSARDPATPDGAPRPDGTFFGGALDGGVADAHVGPASDGGSSDAAAAAWCPLPGCPAAPLRAGADLQGVWTGPAGEVWAVGESGMVGRRAPDSAGGAWCWCNASAGADLTLRSVWGTSGSDVWIVGDNGKVLHFDGHTFAVVDVHSSATLSDVWGASTSNLFVVGAGGTVRHFDGDAWTSADVGADHDLRSVWGASASAVFAVGRVPVFTPSGGGGPPWEGAEAEVFRWDGNGAWTRPAAFLELRGSAGFDGIGGSGPGDVWAVGHKVPSGAAAGFAFAARFDGSTWTAQEVPEDLLINRSYTDVAPDGAGGAWMCGTGDSAVHFDGSAWSAADATTSNLLAIDGRGDRLWAVGRDGKVLRRGSAGWVVDLPATTPVP